MNDRLLHLRGARLWIAREEECGNAVVPGGVYPAMVNELRRHGYSRTQLQAEIGNVLVVPTSGSRAGNPRCSQRP